MPKKKPAPKKAVIRKSGPKKIPKKKLNKNLKEKPKKINKMSPKKTRIPREVPVEKRQYLRLDYSRLISFTHYDTDSLVEIPGKLAAVHDLSEQGILIETAESFEPGNVIDLDIAFEQDVIIPAQAEVVHCNKTRKGLYRTGLKFLRIEDEPLAYLKNFLDHSVR